MLESFDVIFLEFTKIPDTVSHNSLAQKKIVQEIGENVFYIGINWLKYKT